MPQSVTRLDGKVAVVTGVEWRRVASRQRGKMHAAGKTQVIREILKENAGTPSIQTRMVAEMR